jgi:hypothetical protein
VSRASVCSFGIATIVTVVLRSQNFNYYVFIPNSELLWYSCDNIRVDSVDIRFYLLLVCHYQNFHNVLCAYFLSYSAAAPVLAKC